MWDWQGENIICRIVMGERCGSSNDPYTTNKHGKLCICSCPCRAGGPRASAKPRRMCRLTDNGCTTARDELLRCVQRSTAYLWEDKAEAAEAEMERKWRLRRMETHLDCGVCGGQDAQ